MTDWTESMIHRLRDLWAEGLSTAEIGRRIGVTKNAVVGRAHRMGLPARPSPIRRGEGAPRPRVRTRSVPKLPELASLRRPYVSPSERPKPPPAPPVVKPPEPFTYARVVSCCWPIGEPGTRTFRFCEAPSAPGYPYCQSHCERAYAKREKAA